MCTIAIMRTRRESYPSASAGIAFSIRPPVQKKSRQVEPELKVTDFNQTRSSNRTGVSGLDALPDDILIIILSALVSIASSPADLVNILLMCRRFCAIAMHPQVLANASPAVLAVTASSWSEGAHRFLKQCADAGNTEACYTLGMIRFYCLSNRGAGASLMAKAAMQAHSAALHSLAVIQFNGSGGTRKDKDLKAGVALCVRAATLGHVDAMRELGHCLQDGYGVVRNIYEGRRLLLEANAREAASAVVGSTRGLMEVALKLSAADNAALGCSQVHETLSVSNASSASSVSGSAKETGGDEGGLAVNQALDRQQMYKLLHEGTCSLLSDFGCTVPPPKLHIANKFLVDWFNLHPPEAGLRLCSHGNCGRPETRRHEFRRCSACGCVNYCSRACQALDWKIRHKYDCQPVADWQDHDAEEDDQVPFDIDQS